MTPESPALAEAPQPPSMGEFSRIMGVFFEPKKAFEDIARRPKWLVPMVLVILAMLAFTMSVGQHIGWDRVIRHQMESNQQMAQLPADQREARLEMATKIGSVTAIAGPAIGIPIVDVILAAILLAMVAMMGASLKFKQIFSIVCYAGLPTIVFAILAVVVVFLKNPDDFNVNNPLAFNPAAFMDPQTAPKFLYGFASAIDLFRLWGVLLTAVGIKAAAGKRISFGGALTAAFIPWLVFALLGGVGAMFR